MKLCDGHSTENKFSGAYRRRAPLAHDLDVVVKLETVDRFLTPPAVHNVVGRGPVDKDAVLSQSVPVDDYVRRKDRRQHTLQTGRGETYTSHATTLIESRPITCLK